MTGFYDASRPLLDNGAPCWMGTNIALPGVTLDPAESQSDAGKFDVRVMVWRGSGSSWAYATIQRDQVVDLLADWVASPEDALRKWFQVPPPSQGAVEALQSVEELGL